MMLAPLQTLVETKRGQVVRLPEKLQRLYGTLRLPRARRRGGARGGPQGVPYVFSNFVSTLDGVVSLGIQGHDGGGDISGFSVQDRMVMGLLRAVADVVIVGGGSLAADPDGLWTPDAICPELTADYGELSARVRKAPAALNVVVSASGHLDLDGPVFRVGERFLIVTSRVGARRLSRQALPPQIEVAAAGGRGRGRGRGGAAGRGGAGGGALSARAILDAVRDQGGPCQRVLIEGGPRLLGSFYAERLIDEQFLTLSPQLAGREVEDERISLVMGKLFTPKDSRWATLVDVRRGGSHLFLRYGFASA